MTKASKQQVRSSTDGKDKEENQWTAAPSKQAMRPALIAVLLSIGLYLLVHTFSQASLPNPHTYEPTAETPFNLTRALVHIKHLSESSRFVNTRALTTSLQYVQTVLEGMRSEATANNLELDIDWFESDPSSFMNYIRKFNMRHSYDNILSVVARLRPAHVPQNSSMPSLLINAHVDSAVGAPGASDNLVAVGFALEITRALCRLPEKDLLLQRPIIFLFNGAEEVGLQGAHSFVTQHAWGDHPAAHINLESIGSGSAYFLFRLGPGAPWLARAYRDAVTRPYGSVCATDVFNAELIPAETDFQVFDKVAGIPGYDLALIDHGYVYHTIYDDFDHVNAQGVLHGGLSVLQLTRQLAGALDAIGRRDEPAEDAPVVFFDLGRRFMFVYSEFAATCFNTFVVALCISVWARKILAWTADDRHSFARMCFILVACMFAAFASATVASIVFANVVQARLVWFGSMTKAFAAYGPCIAFGVLCMLSVLLPRRLPKHRFDHMLLAVTLFYGVVLLICVRSRFMTAYLPAAILLILSVCALQGERVSALAKHAQIMLLFSAMCTEVMFVTLSVMLPLMGRVQLNTVPHDSVAALLIAFSCVMYVLLPSLPILCELGASLRRLRAIAFAIAVLSALWFLGIAPRMNESGEFAPYSPAAPKRTFLLHFHAPQMDPPSVLFLSAMGPERLHMERLTEALVQSDMDVGSLPAVPHFGALNCTPLEAFMPYKFFLQHVTVLRSGRVPDLPPPSLQVVSESRTDNGWNVSFVARAPESHALTLRFDVREGSPVVGWSFNAPIRDSATFQGTGWVKHHGSSQVAFWLLVKDGDGKDAETASGRPKTSVVVCSARLGYSRSPHDLARLRSLDWETPSAAVSVAEEFLL